MKTLLVCIVLCFVLLQVQAQRFSPSIVSDLIDNGQFDYNYQDTPTGWGYVAAKGSRIRCNPVCSYVFVASGIRQRLSQTHEFAPGEVLPNDFFEIGTSSRAEHWEGSAKVIVLITYADAPGERFTMSLPAGIGTQFARLLFNTLYAPVKIKVKIVARVGAGLLYLDSVQLLHLRNS